MNDQWHHSNAGDGLPRAVGVEPNPIDTEPLGAVDIVEAFVGLRHELKLQVRGGRDLQKSLGDQLQRIEQRIEATRAVEPMALASTSNDEGRKLAEIVAEVEEGLCRAVESLAERCKEPRPETRLLDRFDAEVKAVGWVARYFAGSLLEQMRSCVEQSTNIAKKADDSLRATHQGLELLLVRVHRLMQKCDLQRIDVLHLPFDAETMHAIDVIDAPAVPTSHVAQQIRPAYLWQNKVIRCADVRLAQ